MVDGTGDGDVAGAASPPALVAGDPMSEGAELKAARKPAIPGTAPGCGSGADGPTDRVVVCCCGGGGGGGGGGDAFVNAKVGGGTAAGGGVPLGELWVVSMARR